MQIDFHHAVTYVTARLAGFNAADANTIAYAAQYVDDSTSSELIRFDNKVLFSSTASAHNMIDLRNIRSLSDYLTWVPFHFLPGNGGKPAGENPSDKFIDKIVCTPNSPIAQDMIASAIQQQDKSYALHRLGVTMHVYADTWAHQNFAGVIHRVNQAGDVRHHDAEVPDWWHDLKEKVLNVLDHAVPELGHAQAGIFPDLPFLHWQYKNGNGVTIDRDNTRDFCDAANHMCMAMQRYRAKDSKAPVSGLDSATLDKMRDLFRKFGNDDGQKRHDLWVGAIKNGEFPSLKGEVIGYRIDNRPGSWKYDALGSIHDEEVHKYKTNFLETDWWKFQTALRAHRSSLASDILPKYGICIAA